MSRSAAAYGSGGKVLRVIRAFTVAGSRPAIAAAPRCSGLPASSAMGMVLTVSGQAGRTANSKWRSTL